MVQSGRSVRWGAILCGSFSFPENVAATFALWSDVRSHLDASTPTAFLVGEAWDDIEVAVQYGEAALILTLSGVPFLNCGEEVGMASSWPHEDVRRPLHWSSGAAAGFTSGTPWQTPGSNVATNNVAVVQGESASLWHHYRRFVQVRLASPALRSGTYHRPDPVGSPQPARPRRLRRRRPAHRRRARRPRGW